MANWKHIAVGVALLVLLGVAVKSDNRTLIAPHFAWSEVDPTGLGAKRPAVAANLALVAQKAERLRAAASAFLAKDCPLTVTPHGGYDPPEGFADGYHRKSPTSQHHSGSALDLYTPDGFTLEGWHALAQQQHAKEGGGLGLYPWGVHVDVRKDVAFWQETDPAADA